MKIKKKIMPRPALAMGAAVLYGILNIGVLFSYAEQSNSVNVPEGMTEEEYEKLSDNVIEWDEISDIVRYKNPTYLSYVEQSGSQIGDMKTAASWDITDIKDQLDLVDDTISAIKESQENIIGSENSEIYQQLEQSLTESTALRSTLKSSLNEMGKTSRNLGYSEQNLEISLSPLRDQLISAIESLIISYKTVEYNYDMLQSQVGLYSSLYEAEAAMQAQGMATEQDVANYKNQLDQVQNSLNSLESTLRQLKDNILVQCGYEAGADVEIEDLPEADRDFLSTRDYEEDKQTAINANSTVQSSWSTSGYSGDVFKYRNANASATEGKAAVAMDSIKAELEKQTLLAEASDTSLRKAEIINNSADLKYSLGMLGKSEYEAQKLEYTVALASAKINDLNLHLAIENYKYAVRGLMTVE